MAERCGAPHPDDPQRLCEIKAGVTHGEHWDKAHRNEHWPNVEVQERARLLREQKTTKGRGKRKAGMTEIAAAIAGSKHQETKSEGMDRALSVTPDEFKDAFYDALHEVALAQDLLTSDHVRMVLDRRGVEVENPSAIGPLMPQGAKRGWIAKTDERAVSERGLGKGRDGLTVWKSLINRGVHVP